LAGKRALQDPEDLCAMQMRPLEVKPFCDGAHARVGFDGAETASREPYLNEARAIEGQTWSSPTQNIYARSVASATPTDRSGIRSDSPMIAPCARCSYVRSEIAPPGVWLPGTRRRKSLSSQSCRFLSVSSKIRRSNAADRSGCAAEFPWSPHGFEYEVRNGVTLCRCGQSQNKPFCDGTHAQAKFKDT
jgi:CDGSH-type Zn-finger protein